MWETILRDVLNDPISYLTRVRGCVAAKLVEFAGDGAVPLAFENDACAPRRIARAAALACQRGRERAAARPDAEDDGEDEYFFVFEGRYHLLRPVPATDRPVFVLLILDTRTARLDEARRELRTAVARLAPELSADPTRRTGDHPTTEDDASRSVLELLGLTETAAREDKWLRAA
jgi:hypothetical protein